MTEQTDRSMQDLKPTVWIGKQGCTGTMIDEIVSQLKKRHVIKVKWLQSCEVDPEAIAKEAKAELIEVRGKTMVLREKKGAKSSGPVKVPAKVPAKRTAKEKARVSAVPPEKPGAKTTPKDSGASKRGRAIGSMGRARK